MRYFLATGSVIALLAATPALAGTEVLYEATPDWVQVAEINDDTVEDGPPEVLFDAQYRLEDGVVRSYYDRMVRMDNPDALTSEGTLKYSWSPDKGDITIHRVEITRDGETIDLVEGGLRFDVIRREQNLERRLLDGVLTATIAVPDLREGDTLRVAYSTTLEDQALGDEMQVAQYLPRDPWRVGKGRVLVSWPKDADITWGVEDGVPVEESTSADAFNSLSVSLPLEKAAEMPGDAPSRFRRASVLRVGSFADWQELSRVMAPHFEDAAKVEPDSVIAAEARKIMARSDDPLERTAHAVRLVQDQVSYLLNGLDGGNYLPQASEETWEKRYGDCKAKSVLLLTLLREMDIDSNVVLVSTRGGDALPELLPLPANFDHMIVRATIDGVNYWLDGTSKGTRLSNLADVPPFFYALPVEDQGADLVAMDRRSNASASMLIKINADHSAGVDLPAMINMDVEIVGPAAAQIQAIVDQNDPKTEKQFARVFASRGTGDFRITSYDFDYDADTATGRVSLGGVSQSSFLFGDDQVTLELDIMSDGVNFSPNRARSAWKDIPVMTYGPVRNVMEMQISLPPELKGYELVGQPDVDQSFGNSRFIRSTEADDLRVIMREEAIGTLGEIAAADLPEAKRAALRVAKADLMLKSPADPVRRWELDDAQRAAKTKAALEAYNLGVEDAEADDFSALRARASFFALIYDHEKAYRDLTTIIAAEPSEYLYARRARIAESMRDYDQALADMEAAYDLNPSNSNAFGLAYMMGQNGRTDDAMTLLDSLPVSEDDLDDLAQARASVHGYAGALEEGFATLAERREENAENASLLNADCWYRGTNNFALDTALDLCTKAVEQAENPMPVLDSRALVKFRLGQFDEAIMDLDAALKLAPQAAAPRYLRGVVRLSAGDNGGKTDVTEALRMAPNLVDKYARYGITPPS